MKKVVIIDQPPICQILGEMLFDKSRSLYNLRKIFMYFFPREVVAKFHDVVCFLFEYGNLNPQAKTSAHKEQQSRRGLLL